MGTTELMITVRLMTPEEGSLVQRLVKDGGGPAWEWLDWTHAYPYWLIGDVDGEPKGTIMVHPGVPFGRMEYLVTTPSLSFRHKALLCKRLAYAGLAACQNVGSQAVISTIDSTDSSWKSIAEHRGWVSVGEGSYMLKRCT